MGDNIGHSIDRGNDGGVGVCTVVVGRTGVGRDGGTSCRVADGSYGGRYCEADRPGNCLRIGDCHGREGDNACHWIVNAAVRCRDSA